MHARTPTWTVSMRSSGGGRDGTMDTNILIRTMTLMGRQVELRAGGGIVADSIPERELEEARAKARGLLAVFDTGTRP